MVFRSITTQLAKENEKFIYNSIREGARARDYEEAIEWLVSAGMLNRVYNLSKIDYPLSVYAKLDSFKLFVFDTGLLKCMANIDNSSILLKSDYQFKGPLTENYVLQQLKSTYGSDLYYFSNKNSELDFIMQNKTSINIIEVKAGEDKSSPSFKKCINENNELQGIRYSRRNYIKNGKIINIPLYLVNKTIELI